MLSSRRNSRGGRGAIAGLLSLPVLVIFAPAILLPFFIVVTTSFKSDVELPLANFKWLPNKLLLSNYVKAFQFGNWPRYFFNSVFVTILTVTGSVFLNSLAGFSFARLRFTGKHFLFVLLLVGIMVPPQSIIIPQFILMRSIPFAGGNDMWGRGGTGWLDTYWALVVPFLSGSFGIFLCRQFYLTFPRALDDASGRVS